KNSASCASIARRATARPSSWAGKRTASCASRSFDTSNIRRPHAPCDATVHVAIFFAVMRLDDVKNEVAVGTRILAALGLASGVRASLGHVSMRVPDDPNKFVVKGRGYAVDSLSTIRANDLVVCDLEAF